MLIEKIFQRDDKFFLIIYRLFLALILYFSSSLSYFLRNKTWVLPERYIEATVIISLIFIVLSLFKSKENRFKRGIAQWFRVELMVLTQTFIIAIMIPVMLKISDIIPRIMAIYQYSNILFFIFIF